MKLAFTKMTGIGNDFVFIEDLEDEWQLTPEAVQWLCDRRFGVGADGVILVRAGKDGADFYMHYLNADGSLAEMCGNGARCFVKYLVDHRLIGPEASSAVIGTLGGLRPVTFTRDAVGRMSRATVDMGEPLLAGAELPSTFSGERVVDEPLDTPAGVVRLTGVAMPNPHAVLWVDDVDAAPVDSVGPFIEHHAAFPKGTNVEFAHVVQDGTIELRVWERGVGETLACGTGACATLVAAVLGSRSGRAATIALPGGKLEIEWGEDGHVRMTGTAAEVFSGSIELPEDETAAC